MIGLDLKHLQLLLFKPTFSDDIVFTYFPWIAVCTLALPTTYQQATTSKTAYSLRVSTFFIVYLNGQIFRLIFSPFPLSREHWRLKLFWM